MVTNTIYAKLLDAESFGRLMLVQALAFLLMGVLPMGFDSLIARREIAAPLPIIRQVLAIGFGVSAICLYLTYLYLENLGAELFLLLLVAGVTGAAVRFFAAIEQGSLRFLRSQTIAQMPNLIYLASGAYFAIFGISSWIEAGIAFAFSHFVAALYGLRLTPTAEPKLHHDRIADLWQRALALIGIFASLLLLNHIALFVAAGTLGLRDVGILGLATTLIASPFRLLSHGVGFTLLPRLTACGTRARRKRLIFQELAIGIGLASFGAVSLFLIVPPFVDAIFGGDYRIPMSLIAALLFLGFVRLIAGVATAAVNALANTRGLHLFNITGWASAALAGLLAFKLSEFGADGIVYGVAIGWAIRVVFAGFFIRQSL